MALWEVDQEKLAVDHKPPEPRGGRETTPGKLASWRCAKLGPVRRRAAGVLRGAKVPLN